MSSECTQKILVWWGLAMTAIYGAVLFFLLRMLPPPSAAWPAERVAQFYADNSGAIKVGAVIASWTSAFMVPIAVVVAIQIARHEKGRPVWSILAGISGSMMSIFLVLPPLFWGVAAFTPTRAPEITATVHELGLPTLVTTDQYFVFIWVAVVVVCLVPNSVAHTPFPRWFGYFSGWVAVMFEVGAVAFLAKSGPFSWNGLLVFWIPLSAFGAWLIVMAVLLFRAINAQAAERDDHPALVDA